eukprot:4789082-Prymnesium_polylepis.1
MVPSCSAAAWAAAGAAAVGATAASSSIRSTSGAGAGGGEQPSACKSLPRERGRRGAVLCGELRLAGGRGEGG